MGSGDLADDQAEMQAMLACPHQDAVFWNPYNHVVQCHRCGTIFAPWDYQTPLPASVAPLPAEQGEA